MIPTPAPGEPTYRQFVSDLLETGSVVLGGLGDLDHDDAVSFQVMDADDIAPAIREFELLYRQNLPGDPPALNIDAATWASLLIYHICQLIVRRDLDSAVMHKLLDLPVPDTNDHAVIYSADIFFRFLPSLESMADAIAKEDPLHKYFSRYGELFPLSSVSMCNIDAEKIEGQVATLLDSRCLRTMYIDRIISASDAKRLASKSIADLVQSAANPLLGLDGQLTPGFRAQLNECK